MLGPVQAEAGRDALAAAIRQRVPLNAGVYSFLDDDGKSIYIGKAVNLRRRMLSYFGQGASTGPRISRLGLADMPGVWPSGEDFRATTDLFPMSATPSAVPVALHGT